MIASVEIVAIAAGLLDLDPDERNQMMWKVWNTHEAWENHDPICDRDLVRLVERAEDLERPGVKIGGEMVLALAKQLPARIVGPTAVRPLIAA